ERHGDVPVLDQPADHRDDLLRDADEHDQRADRVRRLRDEDGTIIVMVILLLTALVAMIALTFDFGKWYQTHRNLQAAADAAVLAGAYDLPDTATARASATNYANLNVSGLDSAPNPSTPDTTTVEITLTKTVASSFAQLVGVTSKTITAHARAQIG